MTHKCTESEEKFDKRKKPKKQEKRESRSRESLVEKIKKEETSEEFAETLEQSSRGSHSAKEKKRLKRTVMLTRVLHPDRLLLLVGKTFALFAIGKYEEARERVRAHFYRAGNEHALPLRQRLAIFPVKRALTSATRIACPFMLSISSLEKFRPDD